MFYIIGQHSKAVLGVKRNLSLPRPTYEYNIISSVPNISKCNRN